MAQISVGCRCNVKRTIDTNNVGPWRLRCKQCGDVLYDPTQQGRGAPRSAPAQGPGFIPEDQLLIPDDDDMGGDDGVNDSQFERWLHASNELQVMMSSDGTDAPKCSKHTTRRVVAACTRCSALLCKWCLDRCDDEFVCAECVQKVAGMVDPEQGGLMSWFKRILGGK